MIKKKKSGDGHFLGLYSSVVLSKQQADEYEIYKGDRYAKRHGEDVSFKR